MVDNKKIPLLTIKNYISSLDSIKRAVSQDTLGSVLSKVNSSHSAVFIYDQKEFEGLISPYKTLYASNFPYTTKVSSLLFYPPAILANTPIYKVAKYMLATKIYGLPVFGDDGTPIGVIYAKDILTDLIQEPSLHKALADYLRPQSPVTIPVKSLVKDVFHKLKEKGVSRLIVVDAEGDLAGIVSRRDLMRSLTKPTPKMRFPNEGTVAGRQSMAGEKVFRQEEPIRKYYTSRVFSISDKTTKEKIISGLLESPHNSVILVNGQNKPTGFLSMRDLLQAVTLLRPEEDVPLNIKKPSKAVSSEEFERAIEYLQQFGKKLKKRMEVEKIEVATTEPKSQHGNTKSFNTTLIVTPVAGKALVSTTKHKVYLDGIQQAISLIQKQYKRSGVSKNETRYSSD